MHSNMSLFREPDSQSLADKRCTTKVIDVLLHVLQQAADPRRDLNHPLTECMTLLAMLRAELNVAQGVLARIAVDQETLEGRLNTLLARCERHAGGSEDVSTHSNREASATVWDLVERSSMEAASLKHEYVGSEHLLLAIVRGADAGLSAVLSASGITYEGCREAIVEILRA